MNNYNKNPNDSGFIALISAIIISVLLLIISVSIGSASFFSRFNVLDGEFKTKSRNLAEGCLSLAEEKWALSQINAPYIINLGGGTCTILNIQNNIVNGQIVVTVRGDYNQAVTGITAVIKASNLSLISIIYF